MRWHVPAKGYFNSLLIINCASIWDLSSIELLETGLTRHGSCERRPDNRKNPSPIVQDHASPKAPVRQNPDVETERKIQGSVVFPTARTMLAPRHGRKRSSEIRLPRRAPRSFLGKSYREVQPYSVIFDIVEVHNLRLCAEAHKLSPNLNVL